MIAEQANPGLNEVVTQLLEEAANYGRAMFTKMSKVAPTIFFTKSGRVGHIIVADLVDDTKDAIATFIHELRKTTECTIFVSEVWTNMEKLPKGMTGEAVRRYAESLPKPSETLTKEECIMLLVYVEERKLIFLSKIARNPDSLGEFDLAQDSSLNINRMSGRFIG
jgi:hypothetical protein